MNIGLDFDGTLVTCHDRHVALMRTCARTLGIPLDGAAYWEHKREGQSNALALDTIGIEPEAAATLCGMWSREIERFPWLGFDQPIGSIEKTLAAMVGAGHRLHLLTARANAAHLHMQLARLRVQPFFTSVTVVRHGKVADEKAAALGSRHCDFFIGDTESDDEAARRAGVPFGAVASGMRSEAFLRACGIASVQDTLHSHLHSLVHIQGLPTC